MKAFMEEYGVIVVAVLIIMLIAVVASSSIGPSIRDGIISAVGKLTATLNGAIGG